MTFQYADHSSYFQVFQYNATAALFLVPHVDLVCHDFHWVCPSVFQLLKSRVIKTLGICWSINTSINKAPGVCLTCGEYKTCSVLRKGYRAENLSKPPLRIRMIHRLVLASILAHSSALPAVTAKTVLLLKL